MSWLRSQSREGGRTRGRDEWPKAEGHCTDRRLGSDSSRIGKHPGKSGEVQNLRVSPEISKLWRVGVVAGATMSRSGSDLSGNLGRDFGGIVEGIVCEVPYRHARRNSQNFLSKCVTGRDFAILARPGVVSPSGSRVSWRWQSVSGHIPHPHFRVSLPLIPHGPYLQRWNVLILSSSVNPPFHQSTNPPTHPTRF
jgi:hypothetical protein